MASARDRAFPGDRGVPPSDPGVRGLLLDEPCAGLDPAARENFLQFIDTLGQVKNAPTLVLVTHHVEEITPVYSHALLLRDGWVFDSGTKQKMLTSKQLSSTFRSNVRLVKSAGRFRLELKPKVVRAS